MPCLHQIQSCCGIAWLLLGSMVQWLALSAAIRVIPLREPHTWPQNTNKDDKGACGYTPSDWGVPWSIPTWHYFWRAWWQVTWQNFFWGLESLHCKLVRLIPMQRPYTITQNRNTQPNSFRFWPYRWLCRARLLGNLCRIRTGLENLLGTMNI